MGKLDFSANASQLEELAAYMASQINVPTIGIGGGYAPIGTIISVMGTTAPQDYLACDGTVYNIADYPQLADYFESQFGESNHFGGNGTTTFAVPDLQGEFLRGTGANSHKNQGRGANVGDHQDGTKHHAISLSPASNKKVLFKGYHRDWAYTPEDHDSVTLQSTNYVMEVTGSSATKSTESNGILYVTSRPTNTSVLYCIKAVVAGDVYSTEERVVGTWIDGKPIYQKTINCGALPNASTKDVPTGLTNVRIRGFKVYAFNPTTGMTIIFPNISLTVIANCITAESIDNGSKIRLNTGSVDRSTFSECYATIQYTKTTD